MNYEGCRDCNKINGCKVPCFFMAPELALLGLPKKPFVEKKEEPEIVGNCESVSLAEVLEESKREQATYIKFLEEASVNYKRKIEHISQKIKGDILAYESLSSDEIRKRLKRLVGISLPEDWDKWSQFSDD